MYRHPLLSSHICIILLYPQTPLQAQRHKREVPVAVKYPDAQIGKVVHCSTRVAVHFRFQLFFSRKMAQELDCRAPIKRRLLVQASPWKSNQRSDTTNTCSHCLYTYSMSKILREENSNLPPSHCVASVPPPPHFWPKVLHGFIVVRSKRPPSLCAGCIARDFVLVHRVMHTYSECMSIYYTTTHVCTKCYVQCSMHPWAITTQSCPAPSKRPPPLQYILGSKSCKLPWAFT